MALVLVTGANGRIGTAVVKALLARGDAVRAVVRPGSAFKLPDGVEKFEFDLSSGKLPAAAFDKATHIVHLAGLVGEHPYKELVLQNAFATKNFLSACPTSVRRVVMASSISVYGEHRGKIVDESFEAKGESDYGKSKLLSETFARAYCGQLPLVFLRFGMVYGPGFEDGYYPVLRYLRLGKMKVLGDGSNRLPLLHIGDCVQAMLLALDKSVPRCREYNIVGGEKPTQKEILEMASLELGVAPPNGSTPVIVAAAAAKAASLFGDRRFSSENVRQMSLDRAYSTKRAAAELGFEAKVKLAIGLKEVVKLYLERVGKNGKNGVE